jgi:hypothetical protein
VIPNAWEAMEPTEPSEGADEPEGSEEADEVDSADDSGVGTWVEDSCGCASELVVDVTRVAGGEYAACFWFWSWSWLLFES